MTDPTGDLGIDKLTASVMLAGLIVGTVLVAGLIIGIAVRACEKWRNRNKP